METQLAYWPADQSEPLRDCTVGSVLSAAVDKFGTARALVAPPLDAGGQRREWTFAQLGHEAERAAAALLTRFKPGERVAVWAPGLPEWIFLELGAALAGLVLVTVNPAYRPAELRYVLRQSRAAGIFLVPRFRSAMAEFLDDVRPDLPDLRETVFFPDWADFLDSAGGTAPELPEVLPSDAAQIQYTSGTTGMPKGAVLHHHGLANSAHFYASRLGLGPEDTYINPMPLFHTAGCVIGCLGPLQAGSVQVVVPAFEPDSLLRIMEEERGTGTLCVPTMLLAMMERPGFAQRDLSSMRFVVSGGSTVPPQLAADVEAAFRVRFVIIYGTTECSPMISQTHLDDNFEDRSTTVGTPLPQIEAKIVDPGSGEIVRRGEQGEICLRGFLVMLGYHEMPEATAAAVDEDGWYHTGDLASMDERGYCRIEGRLKDMIIRGGENIYPKEIEEVLFRHPGVADAAVVGVPDPRYGEMVVAFIRSAGAAPPSVEELFAWCREHLAPHKTPVRWSFVDEFPLTPSGKVKKFALRDQLMAEAG